MSRTLNDLPKLYELLELDVSIIVEVDRIEEHISRYCAESGTLPVLLRFITIDSFIAILIKNVENLCYCFRQFWAQVLSNNKLIK